MANWSNPTLTTNYDVFVQEAKNRDEDAITLLLNAATNLPTGAIKLVRSPVKFQEWDGAAFQDRVLSVGGGGTGATDPAGARGVLGIGTMGTQNSNAVTITGGTISGLTSLTLASSLAFSANNSFDIGTNAVKCRRIYLGDGCVLPAGTDKFVTA